MTQAETRVRVLAAWEQWSSEVIPAPLRSEFEAAARECGLPLPSFGYHHRPDDAGTLEESDAEFPYPVDTYRLALTRDGAA